MWIVSFFCSKMAGITLLPEKGVMKKRPFFNKMQNYFDKIYRVIENLKQLEKWKGRHYNEHNQADLAG